MKMKPTVNKLFGKTVLQQLRDAKQAAFPLTPGQATIEAIIQSAYERQREIDEAATQPERSRIVRIPRKRNEHIDALASACGGHPETMTHSAIRAVAVAWAEIKAVSPDCTPEELKRRADRYRSLHPTWPCTAGALAKHWDSLGVSLGRTESARSDAYIAPPDWLRKAQAIYPEADFTGREWSEIPITLRGEILRRTA